MKLKLSIVLLGAAASLFVSCQQETPQEEESFGVSLVKNSSDHNKGQTFVMVSATDAWTLNFMEQLGWASLSKTSGSGNATVYLNWNANNGEQTRSLTIILTSGTKEESCTFTQTSVAAENTIIPDPVSKWMELPATNNSKWYFITHPMTIDRKKFRNYSYYWDKDNLVARWVAYPLNSDLLKGSCGRSEAWGLDPRVPRIYQPVITSPFGGSWARGHQLPSADRQILAYNKETFYGVNITAQNYNLNGGAWFDLESYVRNHARNLDTLYVVTGCTVGGSRTVKDNDGKSVAVPSGYFKALLGYSKKKKIGANNGGYSAIAFYYDNENYSGGFMNAAITVSELETETGIDFFVNLPDAIGASKANSVENTIEDWWNN